MRCSLAIEGPPGQAHEERTSEQINHKEYRKEQALRKYGMDSLFAISFVLSGVELVLGSGPALEGVFQMSCRCSSDVLENTGFLLGRS
jgi:hypothetical protein